MALKNLILGGETLHVKIEPRAPLHHHVRPELVIVGLHRGVERQLCELVKLVGESVAVRLRIPLALLVGGDELELKQFVRCHGRIVSRD